MSITETVHIKELKETKGKDVVSMDRGKRKGLHQMDCCSSAISTSLAGCGDFLPWLLGLFFLQNYVVVIIKKKGWWEIDISLFIT